MTPTAMVSVGLAAGLHVALYGAYKDSPHESFLLRRFIRELFIAVGMALALAVLAPGARNESPFVIYLTVFALTRIVTEFWKLFIRVEPQDDLGRVAPEQPAPIGYGWEQHPDRPAERPRQVGNARVDADDQVAQFTYGRRVREVAQLVAEVAQRRLEVQRRRVVDGGGDALLGKRLADALALGRAADEEVVDVPRFVVGDGHRLAETEVAVELGGGAAGLLPGHDHLAGVRQDGLVTLLRQGMAQRGEELLRGFLRQF